MNEPIVPPRLPKSGALSRFATVFKLAGIFALILLLLIPLAMIRSVLNERLERRNAAVAEITSSWGKTQQIVGPVLIVPYQYSFKTWRDRPAADGKIERVEVVETATANAYFLPAALTVEGTLTPQPLRRGIYRTAVYAAALSLTAEFARPDFAALKIDEANVRWDDARVTVAIPDLRGVKETLSLQWGANRQPLAPGCGLREFVAGLTAGVEGLRASTGPTTLKLDVSLNGSEGIHFTPVGAQNTITLRSPWPDPSFQGAFLPTRRTVTDKGFEAVWEVSFYGRDYAQQWTDQDATHALTPDSAGAAWLGVNLYRGIDAYRNVERAIKYGSLFLVLVFAAFFLFEVLSALRIHPFQYTLVGAALCLFYLGVLSLSEFISFGHAYLASAGVTTILIWFYCAKVLKSGRRTLIIVGLLAAIYGFLYIALQLQDYALLFGTGGLFIVLAIIIAVTRHLDWYSRDSGNVK